MNFVTEIMYILNDIYIENNKLLSENKLNIEIKNDGVNFVLFKPDKVFKEIGKGEFYPFLSKNKNIQKLCDYILFVQYQQSYYSLIIEIKTNSDETLKQLSAGDVLSKFICLTANRVFNKNYVFEHRFISINQFNIKRTTKQKDVKYDSNRHYIFSQKSFNLKEFLK